MKSVKCAFFDFDNTIAKGDTIFKLLVYTIKKHPLTIVRFLLTILYGIGYILHLVSKEKLKETILFPLDLFNSEEQKTFYQEKVVPSYYPHMVQELQKRKDEGYLVFLVTASSEAYMRFNELPIDILMGTQTEIIDGEYTSHIVGKNCKDAHKVERINAYLEKNNLSIDYEHSYGYSDSTSDIPMLKLVKNRVRISKKDGSMSPFVF